MNILRLKEPVSVTATQDRFSGYAKDDQGREIPKRMIEKGKRYSIVGVTLTGNVILDGISGEGWGMGSFLQDNVPAGFNKFGLHA